MFKCIYVFICIAASDDERCVPFRSTSSPIYRFSSIRKMDQFVGQLKVLSCGRNVSGGRGERDRRFSHVVFSRHGLLHVKINNADQIWQLTPTLFECLRFTNHQGNTPNTRIIIRINRKYLTHTSLYENSSNLWKRSFTFIYVRFTFHFVWNY